MHCKHRSLWICPENSLYRQRLSRRVRWGGQGHAGVPDSNPHRSLSREMLNRFHSKKQLVTESLFILVEIC